MDQSFTRRQVLVGVGALLALSGCSREPGSVNYSVKDVTATKPFYIAHRGSGDNWTEHTAVSYSQAVSHGLNAIEVSVHATSDGVLVCHHDPSTLRMTGTGLTIADVTFAELQTLRNDARQWLGPAAPLLPIPRLKDVLDAHAATHIIFIEDKTGKNLVPITDLMKTYPKPTDHFIWKQPANSASYLKARAMGFKTWGYFTPEFFGTFDRYAKNFDMVGIYSSATDAQVTALVSHGKPVICWEVHNRSTRDRMVRLGVQIMMCSNVEYVMSDRPLNTSDTFSTGLRASGDLPWTFDRAWSVQPTLQPETASIRIDDADTASYSMGSMGPISEASYSIHCAFRWPDPGFLPTQHVGMAFGQENDSPYRVQKTSDVGGYHLTVSPSGELALYRRAPGEIDGTQLASISTTPVQPGIWTELSVAVASSGITFSRTDGNFQQGFAPDATYRGGYFSLGKNYPGGPPVEFKSVNVS
ncbi:glycerophosphodiester phosphodiesterase family protein [Arthrobacter sp. GMC3]|uniref:glycerophosphodiester phosphodiesterase n=1 Tax=Arthrobacter sp. GMC3 TaxID=2058894 RepID=UPI000CE2C3B0|nr:glycerophosphodiester phosphodiesterase family protein [Arthrobacter sp. GMC3]